MSLCRCGAPRDVCGCSNPGESSSSSSTDFEEFLNRIENSSLSDEDELYERYMENDYPENYPEYAENESFLNDDYQQVEGPNGPIIARALKPKNPLTFINNEYYDYEAEEQKQKDKQKADADKKKKNVPARPLTKNQIIDIVTEIDLNATEFQDMILEIDQPIYSKTKIIDLYREYMDSFRSPSELVLMAKEIGGHDERWINMVNVLKGTIDCRTDLVELYESYVKTLESEYDDRAGENVDLEDVCGDEYCDVRQKKGGFRLPCEEDPFKASCKPANVGYLMKK